jgi:hypothetical protein
MYRRFAVRSLAVVLMTLFSLLGPSSASSEGAPPGPSSASTIQADQQTLSALPNRSPGFAQDRGRDLNRAMPLTASSETASTLATADVRDDTSAMLSGRAGSVQACMPAARSGRVRLARELRPSSAQSAMPAGGKPDREPAPAAGSDSAAARPARQWVSPALAASLARTLAATALREGRTASTADLGLGRSNAGGADRQPLRTAR